MVWWFCFQRYLLCVVLIVQFLTLLLWICILLYGEPACSFLYLKAVFNLTFCRWIAAVGAGSASPCNRGICHPDLCGGISFPSLLYLTAVFNL